MMVIGVNGSNEKSLEIIKVKQRFEAYMWASNLLRAKVLLVQMYLRS